MSKNKKKLKDTAVGKFLAGAGSNIIGSLGEVLPDKSTTVKTSHCSCFVYAVCKNANILL